jgi:hypothetical protein
MKDNINISAHVILEVIKYIKKEKKQSIQMTCHYHLIAVEIIKIIY